MASTYTNPFKILVINISTSLLSEFDKEMLLDGFFIMPKNYCLHCAQQKDGTKTFAVVAPSVSMLGEAEELMD